jgi:hypothetical protein
VYPDKPGWRETQVRLGSFHGSSFGHLPQNDTTTYITAKSAASVSPESYKDSHLCLRDAFRFTIYYSCGMGFSSCYHPHPQ